MRKEYYEAHKEEIREKMKKRYLLKREQYLEYARKYRKKYPDRIKERRLRAKAKERDYALRKNYGISLETYLKIRKQQNYHCALCPNDNQGKALSVDHDHKTGKVRGLLCRNCNLGLGYFRDETTLLFEAIKYLKRND